MKQVLSGHSQCTLRPELDRATEGMPNSVCGRVFVDNSRRHTLTSCISLSTCATTKAGTLCHLHIPLAAQAMKNRATLQALESLKGVQGILETSVTEGLEALPRCVGLL